MKINKPAAGTKEEITDLVDPKAYDDPKFKKGIALKFERATIKVTKVDRKNKRAWGEHIVLVDQSIVGTHHGHNVDSTQQAFIEYGRPFCTDCQVPVDQPSTEDGDVKALNRRDDELADGTKIGGPV